MKRTSHITSKETLKWVERVQVQRAGNAMLTYIHKNKVFDMINCSKQDNESLSGPHRIREDVSSVAQHMS